MTASAFSVGTMFPSDAVVFSGELVVGGLKSKDRVHSFCASCFGLVYSQVIGAEHRINLRTSMLDKSSDFAPFVELMTSEKVPWIDLPVAHSFPGTP